MEVNLTTWFLAFAPILLLIVLLTVFKFSGSKAGIFTWAAAQIIAWRVFGASPSTLLTALLKSVFLALDVLLIIWGAMYLYQVTRAAGTIQKIGTFLSGFTKNKAYQGIILGWLFPSFLQGMGGFGVPVAVSSPLLVSVGFSPILAVILSSLGHGWGVSFGSMGTSVRTLEAVTGLPFADFAPQAAILLGITAVLSGLIVTIISGGKSGFLSAFPLTILSAAILSIGQYLIAGTDLWVLAVTLPSLISLCAAFLFVALFSPESREWVRTLTPESRADILRSISPYLLLVALILFFNFFRPLKEIFGPFTIAVKFNQTITSLGFSTPAEFGKALNIILHPGTILALTGVLSKLIFLRYGLIEKDDGKNILISTMTSAKKATIAIFTLVGAAVAMRHAGMIEILALGISTAIPRSLFPAASPFIGALGAFITGSNNNSNVLFAPLQLQTAKLLNLPAAWILASQTTGGALGSIMAPAKVILGCNTVGIANQEGQVISRLLAYCLAIILLIGLTVTLITI